MVFKLPSSLHLCWFLIKYWFCVHLRIELSDFYIILWKWIGITIGIYLKFVIKFGQLWSHLSRLRNNFFSFSRKPYNSEFYALSLLYNPSLLKLFKTAEKVFQSSPGLNPINKKILKFLTISTNFQIVFLSKYSEENFQKSVQPAAQKDFVPKISQTFWKNWWVQNSQIFVRKFLRTWIFVDRTKFRMYIL